MILVTMVIRETYLKVWGEHARSDNEVGDHEAGHAKREQNGLAGV